MPPKRRLTPLNGEDQPPIKKTKVGTTGGVLKDDEDSGKIDVPLQLVVPIQDYKGTCPYDGTCYRQNPQHWKEFRHDRQTKPTTPPTTKEGIGYASSSSSDEVPIKNEPQKVLNRYISDSSSSSEEVPIIKKPQKVKNQYISDSSSSSSDDSDSNHDEIKITAKAKAKPKKPTKATKPNVTKSIKSIQATKQTAPTKLAKGKKVTLSTPTTIPTTITPTPTPILTTTTATSPSPVVTMPISLAGPQAVPSKSRIPITDENETKPDLKRKPSLSRLLGDTQPADTPIRPDLEAYKIMLESALISYKVSVENKRLLQNVRKAKNISMDEHNRLLGQYGWTPDEYELGEKEIDVDLQQEKEILAKENGFSIITLKKDQHLNKEEETVWAKASAKFFQTMAKAQGNYEIASLGIVVNTQLKNRFEKKKKEMEVSDSKRGIVSWGFHGSSQNSIMAISKEGFFLPLLPLSSLLLLLLFFLLFVGSCPPSPSGSLYIGFFFHPSFSSSSTFPLY
eukprot:TRINITY_DN8558_c0_g2_i2.p1 TRINITY_DN8558_c0_g2~~TRINITY_DN8558_c0_g2_i2.p1  ORF type:complete len:508 (+),score=138.17 TRINITY_DN8558_c0_g2_i2:90-1613(+)